jgi:tetratricopeptide (TPR) repeat protein
VWEFEAGRSFIEQIRSAVAGSDVFVLFAGRNSLRSLWVKFETQEAEELLRAEILKSALVLIIDRETRPSDLPKWMQRSLVEHVLSPSAARRVIEHHLNRLRGLEQEPLFIGREGLLSEFSEKLIPAPESSPPHLLVVGGLPGIGRRTFLGRGLRDFLSLRVGPIFYLRPTDGIDVLHLALIDELGAMDTKVQLAQAIEQFQHASSDERASVIAQMLASTSYGNFAPIIVDEGALLDSSGRYTVEAAGVFEALKQYPETIVGVIHTRRPTADDAELRQMRAVYTRVPPLDVGATKLFLNQSFRSTGIQATSDQINELAPYLEGYPPAVRLAVAIAKEYGMANVLADKSGLVDFQIRTFAGVLEKLHLTDEGWGVLRILAAETSLPLQALAAVFGRPDDEMADLIRGLVDCNLVVPSGLTYQIAFPVKFAVQSLRGRLTEKEYGTIASHLKAAYWDTTEKAPPIEVIEATVHATLRSDTGDLADFKGLVLPSMIYRSAKDYYDRGGQDAWNHSQRLVSELLKIAPGHGQGLVLLCKTQVRLSQWPEAEKTLEQIRSRGIPEQHFLKGFLHWKRREYAKAVTAFRNAVALGQGSVEVYHGLATCLFRLDNLAEAEKIIKMGLRRRRPNSLLLDLAAQVAISRGNYPEAESYIDRLRRVRADADYHHRLATLLNARGRFQDALPHAEAATHGGRRRFEVEATFIDTLIEVHDFRRATDLLDDLDQRERFGSEKRDVRLGLRCKLYLRRRKWKDAEAVWNELEDKTRPVHLALRQELLQQKIDDITTSPGARAHARAELERLRTPAVGDQVSLFTTAEPETAEEDDEQSESEQQ